MQFFGKSFGRHSRSLLLAFFSLTTIAGAHWLDRTVGRPLLETYTAKETRSDSQKWIVQQDKLGRIFVGGDELEVFDGQSWHLFPIPNAYALRALAFGKNGRIWVGAINQVGYFTESTLGAFTYHSLVSALPETERDFGDVWNCVATGGTVHFVCRNRVLSWDGRRFIIQRFTGDLRLYPIKLGDELWFHHFDTGLYRLTEDGPVLVHPAKELPARGILGLAKDQSGLLLVSGDGFFRPGPEPRPVFSRELNESIISAKLTSFTVLADGNYAVGTLEKGLLLIRPDGKLLRQISQADGLPTSNVFSLATDATGSLWGATPAGTFRLETSGRTTLFNKQTGLDGKKLSALGFLNQSLYAVALDQVYRLSPGGSKDARFDAVKSLSGTYHHLLPISGGALLARYREVDFFDGEKSSPVFSQPSQTFFYSQPTRADPRQILVAHGRGIMRLQQEPDGSFTSSPFLTLPDSPSSMVEDGHGRFWLGTGTRGAFVFARGMDAPRPVKDPSTGEPIAGLATVLSIRDHTLILTENQTWLVDPAGDGLIAVEGIPRLILTDSHRIPGSEDLLLAFNRRDPTDRPASGLGVLGLDGKGQPTWRELSVPELSVIGSIRPIEFSEENGHQVLWVGGGDGLLRFDYESIPTLQPPTPPLIRQDTLNSGQQTSPGETLFSFKDHRVKFQVFTGDRASHQDLTFQFRLGDGTGKWSPPSTRRAFEFTNLYEGEYRFEVRALNVAGQASEPAAFTFRVLPPWYRSNGAYAGYAVGLVLGVVGLILIRDRRIRRRNQELEALVQVRTAELVKANAAKDEFLAGISHEIRNPMNGVVGIAASLPTDALDPEARRKFGLLRQCATHLSSLLEDILDFSKVQAGAIELDSKPFNLHELAESITAITAPDSEKYGIPVELAVSPAVPRMLVGDARRVRQILINFVSNALKFSGRGQVSVTVWCRGLADGRTEVTFAVSDEGPGISPEEQARLFTRFERGAAAQQGRVPGTGLGLALCKGLAEEMGGRIWVESELGRGACFHLSVPFAAAPDEAPAVITSQKSATGPRRLALVVDDQEYNRIVLGDLLAALGFTVHPATNGDVALELAARHDFEVVFLDFNLPGQSGLEVARKTRLLPNRTAHALIVATTAFNTPEKRSACLDAGMDSFLSKPVTRERLLLALSPIIGSEQAAPAKANPASRANSEREPFGNLRLLARSKGVSFATELGVYFTELNSEHRQLDEALAREDAAEAGRYAHMLCGRCSFVFAQGPEETQRRIEQVVARGDWPEARRLSAVFAEQIRELQVSSASSDPAARRG